MNSVLPGLSDGAEDFGALLAGLRRRAGLSQLALALEADVSTRHLSFLESGRARPSPAMVDRLARTLRAAPSEAARLRHAAGFAADPFEANRLGLTARDRLALHAVEVAAEIDAATDLQMAVDAAGRFFQRIGIDHFTTGVVRGGGGPGPVRIEMDRCGRPAYGWLQHFWQRDYRHEDALVARAAAGSGAFFWSDLDREGLKATSRRILDEAREFRIGDGFIVSIPRHDGTIRGFTSWAERLDTDPRSRPTARLVATALIEAADRFAQETLEPGLPARHRELLLAVYDRRSLEPVARSLGLDAAGAQAALREACLDMGADTPARAASRAAALGLLAA